MVDVEASGQVNCLANHNLKAQRVRLVVQFVITTTMTMHFICLVKYDIPERPIDLVQRRIVSPLSLVHDRLHPARIKLPLPIKRQQSIGFLLDIRTVVAGIGQFRMEAVRVY